jgi:curved DNA-binding protein CbpA
VSDYYELLGVQPTASKAAIRKAYALQAREKHPDRFTDPEERKAAERVFQDLTTAFNALMNDASRQEYDASRERPQPTTPEEIARDAYERAGEMLSAGQGGEAITLYRTAVHHAPENVSYQVGLGQALARDPASAREAVQVLDRACQAAPKDPVPAAELAIVLHRQGLRLRAKRALEAATAIAPGHPRVKVARSEVESGDA